VLEKADIGLIFIDVLSSKYCKKDKWMGVIPKEFDEMKEKQSIRRSLNICCLIVAHASKISEYSKLSAMEVLCSDL
jgi:hypothetical protein